MSNCLMFADDTKLYHEVRCESGARVLQDDLTKLAEWSDRWLLRFNASKCKVLHIGKRNPGNKYTLSGNTLASTTLEKDLGVYVDPDLYFSNHVSQKVDVCNRILHTIRRTYKYIDATSMRQLFCALIRPHLEYCHAVRYPILMEDRRQIENVLRRASKMIPSIKNLSYEQRLESLQLPSMRYRQERGDMIEVWKYLHGEYNVDPPFTMDEDRRTRGHSLKIKKMRAMTRQRANFFSNRITDEWNRLPEEIVSAVTLNSFKRSLDKHWSDRRYQTYF